MNSEQSTIHLIGVVTITIWRVFTIGFAFIGNEYIIVVRSTRLYVVLRFLFFLLSKAFLTLSVSETSQCVSMHEPLLSGRCFFFIHVVVRKYCGIECKEDHSSNGSEVISRWVMLFNYYLFVHCWEGGAREFSRYYYNYYNFHNWYHGRERVFGGLLRKDCVV